MLQRIRDRVSGWIAGVIIALVAGAFVLFGIEYYFQQGSENSGDVAKVNGVIITQDDVNQAYLALQKQVMMESGGQPLSDSMKQQLKEYALQTMVMQTGLQTSLEKQGFHVGLQQVKIMIEEAPQFQNQGQFSEEKLMQTLYATGLSPMQFFQRVQSQWIVWQATNGVANSAFVLPSEVDRVYGLMHQQRAFGYLIIPQHSFVSKVQITDAQIQNNYNENKSEYQTPAKVSVSYIELSPQVIAKTVMISTVEAKQYYETHMPKSQSFASVEKKIMQLLQHQRVNVIFSKQNSQLSDLTYTNPDSLLIASKALNLPIQTSGLMTQAGEKTGLFSTPAIMKAIFSQSVFNTGNNSDPITLTDGSVVVLRVAQKVASQPIPLDQVKTKIKQTLIQKAAESQAGLLAYQLQQKIQAGANPAIVAKQNGLQWHAVALTEASSPSTIPNTILSTAFAIPVSIQKNNQPMGVQAVLLNQKDYAVIAVNQVKAVDSTVAADALVQKQLSQKITALWGQLLQHYFVGSVMAHANVKIY